MIRLNCPHCSQALEIPEEYAGQTGGCKHCQQPFTVPILAGDLVVKPQGGTGAKGRAPILLAAGVFIVALVIGAYLLGKGGTSTGSAPETAVAKERDADEKSAEGVSNSPKGRLNRMNTLAAEGKYQEAVDTFERVRAEHPSAIESIDALKVAVLYIQLGDRNKHESLCRWMFDQFPGNKNAVDAERTGKAYVIHPDADDAALLAEATERIDYFVQNEKSSMLQWGRVSRGIAAYRQKRYQDARTILDKEVGNDTMAIQSLSLVYSAMTEYALENEAKGLARLADARAAVAKLPQPGTKAYVQQWSNALTSQLTLAEAERLLGQPATTTASVAQTLPKSKSPKAQRERALQLAREGKYREAVEALKSVRTTKPALITSHDAVVFGIVYSLLEDKAEHEVYSHWVLDKFAKTRDPFDAEHAAKAYLIYPGARDKILMAKSVTLAQIGVDNADPKHKGRAWIYLSQAMAKYRVGAHEEASTWLQKTIDNTDTPNIKALALAYTALNEFSMGDVAGATESFQKAKTLAEKIPKDAWEHLQHAEIVFGEVEAALRGAPK